MKVYYAHSMSLYNKPQEARDVETLTSLGFEVVNPNQKWIQEAVQKEKAAGNDNYMAAVFHPIMDSCDAIAFRSHPYGKIGAGVWFEINYMAKQQKLIIELPNILDIIPPVFRRKIKQ